MKGPLDRFEQLKRQNAGFIETCAGMLEENRKLKLLVRSQKVFIEAILGAWAKGQSVVPLLVEHGLLRKTDDLLPECRRVADCPKGPCPYMYEKMRKVEGRDRGVDGCDMVNYDCCCRKPVEEERAA
jgi:hypothetical protein